MRPCMCERFKGAAYSPGDCRLCWLYHHDPRYQRLWDDGVQTLRAKQRKKAAPITAVQTRATPGKKCCGQDSDDLTFEFPTKGDS